MFITYVVNKEVSGIFLQKENSMFSKLKAIKNMKIIVLVIFLATVLIACSGKSVEEGETSTKEEVITQADSDQLEDELDQIEAIGDVDKGLFNVVLTIPSNYYDGTDTQEKFNSLAKELGYKSITLNEDGSATYTMTKTQHKEVIDDIKTAIDKSLKNMITSEKYPNIISISANKDYTEFNVVAKNVEFDITESFSIYAFYCGRLFNDYSGTQVDNIKVIFYSEASGEVLRESNSKDMAN